MNNNAKKKLFLMTLCVILILSLVIACSVHWFHQTRLILNIKNSAALHMNNATYEMTQPIKYTVIEENALPYTVPDSHYLVFFFQNGECVGQMACGYHEGEFTSSFQHAGPEGIEEAVAASASVAFYSCPYGLYFYYNDCFVRMSGYSNAYEESVELLSLPASLGVGSITLSLTHVE